MRWEELNMRRIKAVSNNSVIAIVLSCILLFNLCGCSLSHKPPVETVEATFEDPAGPGEWFMVSDLTRNRKNELIYYPCYCKINGILIGNAANRCIKEFEDFFEQSVDEFREEAGLNDEYQYMVISGELLYPKDFPVDSIFDDGSVGTGNMYFFFTDQENNELEDEIVWVVDLTNFVLNGMPQKGKPYEFTALYGMKKECPSFCLAAPCYATYEDSETFICRYVDPF